MSEKQSRIEIDVTIDEEASRFDLIVSVTGDLNTAEVIGFMEMAKLQHLDSKRSDTITAYQTPTDSDFERFMREQG